MRSAEMPRGIFSPATLFWRVNREWLIGLGGARALLMELAHPLVAAGVAKHSDFRHDPIGRLYRTTRAMTDITFGSANAGHRSALHIYRCHQRVKGILEERAGPLLPGTPYDADDPRLKLWVLATLIDSTLLIYDLFITPLSLEEKQAYYRDSHLLARLLGIPSNVMPATYEEFIAYMDSMLSSDLLTVSDSAREIAEALLAPPLFGSLVRVASFVGIGLLPERMREDYKFTWNEKLERRLHRLARISRQIRPLVPNVISVNPRAWIAEWHSHQ